MITVGLIPRSALAIEKAGRIVGSEKILAKRIGIRRQKVNYWKLYTLLPCEKAMEIYTVTAGKVSIYELRPDLIFVIRRFVLTLLLVKITGSCNFACSYCYDYNVSKQDKNLSFLQIYDTIKFLLTKRSFITVAFHGGEPLLRFEAIKKTVEDTKEYLQQERNKGKQVLFSIQTNGSLISKKIIDFLESNNICIGISLDGFTEKSNLYRKHINNKTSPLKFFLNLYKTYPTFIKQYCNILAVLHRDNINESIEFVEWAQNLGIKSIYFNILFINRNARGSELLDKVPTNREIIKFYKGLIDKIKARKIWKINAVNITNYVATLAFLENHCLCYNKGPCGAAREFLGITANGKFQICDSIPENISNMSTSYLSEELFNDPARNFARNIWDKFKNKNCKSCALFGLCGGGCIGSSYMSSKCEEVDIPKCVASKVMYKELFKELASSDKNKPLFEYCKSFHFREKML